MIIKTIIFIMLAMIIQLSASNWFNILIYATIIGIGSTSYRQSLYLGFFIGLFPLTSQASLVGQDVTVTFSEPSSGFGDEVDVVTVGAGAEIIAGDGSNIGDNIFLDFDSINIGSESIVLELQGGGGFHSTGFSLLGFGPDASYSFTGLNWGVLPGRITGVDVILDNVIGVALGSEVSFTGDSIDLIVGTLGIGEISGADFGRVTLNLTVDHSPVPLPASLPLFLTGLIFVWRRFRLK